jgi:hypothetical protein
MTRTKALLAAPMALAVILSFGPKAEAADRFGVVGIENRTNVTVRLDHQWEGHGGWATDVLAPGMRKTFWWEYSQQNQDRSPKFHVRFDSDLSPGNFIEKYDLNKFRAPVNDWEHAHKHVFRYDGNRRFIELYDEGK